MSRRIYLPISLVFLLALPFAIPGCSFGQVDSDEVYIYRNAPFMKRMASWFWGGDTIRISLHSYTSILATEHGRTKVESDQRFTFELPKDQINANITIGPGDLRALSFRVPRSSISGDESDERSLSISLDTTPLPSALRFQRNPLQNMHTAIFAWSEQLVCRVRNSRCIDELYRIAPVENGLMILDGSTSPTRRRRDTLLYVPESAMDRDFVVGCIIANDGRRPCRMIMLYRDKIFLQFAVSDLDLKKLQQQREKAFDILDSYLVHE